MMIYGKVYVLIVYIMGGVILKRLLLLLAALIMILSASVAFAEEDPDAVIREWEEKYGLNPKDASDAKKKTLVTGHTNLDVYMCHKVSHLY